MRLFHHRTLTGILTVLLTSVSSLARGETSTSGKVVAVNKDATGTPPGAASRTLAVGTGIIFKERIKTSPEGSTQILFPDQSTLNVGRNSSLVIDEYVYNPKSGTGTMLATLGKGALRFVGGRISHTRGATINTPVASLGIRGGIASVLYPISAELAALDPNLAGLAGELVIGHVGVLKLKNRVSEVLVRPGYAAAVSGADIPIGRPFRINDMVLAQIMSRLTSAPGQSGGIRTETAEAFIAREGVGTTILDDPTDPPGSDPFGYSSIIGLGAEVARSKSQAVQTRFVVAPRRITPAAPPPPPSPPPPYGGG